METTEATKAKKRPNSDEVKKMLLEGDFGSSTDKLLLLTDPISTTQLVLTLDNIKPYDKNPRREKNPAYDEIKASIRSKKKLNNNFNVTRRPGDDLFMVESGGNTRLAILKELYLETADEVFNTVHCLFVPWTSESSILTAHLIENEMRGDMMLIDKAYAAQELKRELEAEQGKKISDREFTRLAEASGYKISTKHLRRFNYAVELDQMIPLILRTGIGGNKLDHIKKVEKAYRQYCEDKTEQFDAAFMAVMLESNENEFWDFDQIRLELDDRLSELTGVRYNLLRLEVDAILFNQPINNTDQFDQNNQQGQNNDQQIKPESEPTIIPQQTQSHKSETMQDDYDEGLLNELEDSVIPINHENSKPTEKEAKTQLKIFRQKGYDLAYKIAKSGGHEERVLLTKCGMGFLMESPSQPLAPYSVCYFNWWLLFGISEQNVREQSHYPVWAFTDLYNRFGEDQRNQDDSLDKWLGSEAGVMQFMYEYLHNQVLVNDRLFTDIFRLMENCRKIRAHFLEQDIWEKPS